MLLLSILSEINVADLTDRAVRNTDREMRILNVCFTIVSGLIGIGREMFLSVGYRGGSNTPLFI